MLWCCSCAERYVQRVVPAADLAYSAREGQRFAVSGRFGGQASSDARTSSAWQLHVETFARVHWHSGCAALGVDDIGNSG
jgi:hypothetical protein